MNTNRNDELQKRYGHLLDMFTDGSMDDWTKQEREEEARNRYGHLMDYAKPNNKIYEDIIMVNSMCKRVAQQRAEVYEQAGIRRQERIEREKREEREHIDRNNAFVNSFLEKKEAEKKAAEEKRMEMERKQNILNSMRSMIDIMDSMSEKIARTNVTLKRDEQRRKEHEEKMEWYRKQHKE